MTKRFGETFSVSGRARRFVDRAPARRKIRSQAFVGGERNAEQMGKTAEKAESLIFLFSLRKQASRPDAGRENGGKRARADAASG